MDKVTLAYCAGVIDSDGCVTIKKRRIHETTARKSAGVNLSATVFVRQVESGAVDLLLATFGGTIRVHGPSTPGGRDLYQWAVSNRKAVAAARAILPFLRIKKKQAEILLEFGEIVGNTRLRYARHWFKLAPGEPLYSCAEACALKGINRATLYQAISNKTVPVIRKPNPRGGKPSVFIPKRFWDSYVIGRGRRNFAPEYAAMKEDCCARIRSLNGPTRGVKSADRRPA